MDIKFGWFTKFVNHKVRIDDSLIDEQIGDLRRRYGKMSERDESGEEDLLIGDFVELEADGKEIKPGGIMHEGTITLSEVKDKATLKKLLGLAKDAEVTVSPGKVSKDADDLARLLGIDRDAAAKFTQPTALYSEGDPPHRACRTGRGALRQALRRGHCQGRSRPSALKSRKICAAFSSAMETACSAGSLWKKWSTS